MKRLLPLFVLMAVASSQAASTSYLAEFGMLSVRMPGPDAICEMRDDRVICTDGAYFIVAGPSGCEDSYGPGSCGRGRRDRGEVANELRCENGHNYQLSTGQHPARCRNDSGGKYCVSFDGQHLAMASCSEGCERELGDAECRFVP